MQTKKRKWKRRLILSAFFLVFLTGVSVYLLFTRFHFSTQTIWPLAQLQWDHQTNIEFDGEHPQIIGHRGSGINSSVGNLIIGNTRTAIANGISAGADWIEIDIRASSDDRLVVFHDERLDERTNGTGNVADINLDKLAAVRVNIEPPESISTLDDIFSEFRSENVKWILDVKAKGIHEQVLKWITDKIDLGELSDDEVIIFGTYDVLTGYKDAGYSLGFTAIWGNTGNRLRVLLRQSQIINRCRELDCDYLVLPVIFANGSLIDDAKFAGFEVWVYGVDDKRDFIYLAKCGVGGFIVDDPEKFELGNGNAAETDNNTLDRSR